MSERMIGIPAAARGGLEAAPAPDPEIGPFLVAIAHDGETARATSVAAVPPPEWLSVGFAAGLVSRNKIVDLIVGEMEPYLFLQMKTYGVRLWAQGEQDTLAELVDALVADELEPFEMDVPDELVEEFRQAAEEG